MGLLSQLLAQHHQTKLAEIQNQAEADRIVLNGAINGTVDPQTGYAAYQRLSKSIPPTHKESFAALGQHLFPWLRPKAPVPAQAANPTPPNAGASPNPAMPLSPSQLQPPPNADAGAGPNPSAPSPDLSALGAAGASVPSSPPALPPPPSALSSTPAPTGPPIPPPIAQAAQLGASGFGPAPLSAPPGGFHIFSPQEQAARTAAGQTVLQTAAHQNALNFAGQDFAARKARLEADPAFAGLSPRQQMEALTTTNISPEFRPSNIPGTVSGASIIPGTKDVMDNPIDPTAQYRVRVFADGTREYQPVVAHTSIKVIPDANSPTKFAYSYQDATGHEVNRVMGATPPAPFVPQTTSSTTQKLANVNGQQVLVPATSSTVRTRNIPGQGQGANTSASTLPPMPVHPPSSKAVPSGLPSGGATGVPAPNAPDANANLPKGSKVLGNSATRQRELDQNPLTPEAQKSLSDTEPVLRMLDRATALLQPVKDQNDPFHYALQRLGYGIGYETKASDLISNLELSKVIGSARVLKGSSRAIEALKLAMQHLPNPKMDSPALMLSKIDNIRQNLLDIQSAAQQYGRKYPGLPAPPTSSALPIAPTSTYAHTATGPGGHQIGTNDGKTWFDVITGQAIK